MSETTTLPTPYFPVGSAVFVPDRDHTIRPGRIKSASIWLNERGTSIDYEIDPTDGQVDPFHPTIPKFIRPGGRIEHSLVFGTEAEAKLWVDQTRLVMRAAMGGKDGTDV